MELKPQEPEDAAPAQSALPDLDDDLTIDDDLAQHVAGGHACGSVCMAP